MPRTVVVACAAGACAAMLSVGSAHATVSSCADVPHATSVAAPTNALAWRAAVSARTAVVYHLRGKRPRVSRWLEPREAPALLVLAHPRVAGGRCWVRVRLPWRPNNAAGWVDADRVALQNTQWRIDVSTARHTLTVLRGGARVRTLRAVVGKPGTPTPAGLFAVTWAIPWHPHSFLGSWVLELTAHSNVLRRFDGGDGDVGIHGRGGASLRDPLGTALSHGCIRLANNAIDWLVGTIGANRLPGTPVQIS